MIRAIREQLASDIRGALEEIVGAPVDPPRIEDPPRREMGDLACTAALQVAKSLGRNPRELGVSLAALLEETGVEGVTGWSVAGPGFLNLTLDRGFFLTRLLDSLRLGPAVSTGEKVVVEHTSINPNKAAHIGHLRNSCMGDTLARVYRDLGHDVEVHNYIDDTGVQVADVVIGFLDLRGQTPAEVADIPEPFDYVCWDLYTEVSERAADDVGLQERRRQVLLALERAEGVESEMGAVVAERIVVRHVRTMARLGIYYDLLVREGDILALDLWAEAFEKLKTRPAVRLVHGGKHDGCWVMQLTDVPGFENLEEADKVLVRSNGAATYVAKDIAYHLWKYGLLDRTFTYEAVPDVDDVVDVAPFATTQQDGSVLPFGNATRAVTVIDVRQSYLQAVVAQAFRVLGEDSAARSLTHFAYEMVGLTAATAQELGIPVEGSGNFVEMSGGRGHGVKADDLMDELNRRARDEVASRNDELSEQECEAIGRQIAVGAVRYFLLKYTRNTVIAFDLDDALSFEGETGPYIQYAAVRAAHIFDKLGERLSLDVAEAVRAAASGGADPLGLRDPAVGAALEADDGHLWELVLALARHGETVQQSADTLEIAVLAKYAFNLAQHFNRFYHGYPVLQADNKADRALRILVAYAFQERLHAVLDLLGIPLPERM